MERKSNAYLNSDDMFSTYAQKTCMENIPCELAYHCFFFPHVEIYEIEPFLFFMLFSISFAQSEESSNEVNCFFTDTAKILISELYHYSIICSSL